METEKETFKFFLRSGQSCCNVGLLSIENKGFENPFAMRYIRDVMQDFKYPPSLQIYHPFTFLFASSARGTERGM